MNILALISTAAITSTAIVSPLPSDYAEPIPSSVSFDQKVALNLKVLGTSTEASKTAEGISPTPQLTQAVPTSTRTPTPSPTVSPSSQLTLKNNSVRIALLGDSMIDTLGPTISELGDELKKTYPQISPIIYNYGVGATNIDYGIQRITSDYEYLGNKIPALASIHPDIVVLESFAYNPYSYDTGAIDQHWIQLGNAVSTLRKTIPGVKIVIAATIAPNALTFGDGAPMISFSFDEKYKKVKNIKEYLESTTRFAIGEHLPLADAYHPSLMENGNGDPKYINGGDHIHPSDEGRRFFSQIVAQTIIEANYLK